MRLYKSQAESQKLVWQAQLETDLYLVGDRILLKTTIY